MEAYKLDQKHYTYADYITWDDDKRYEIIDGIAYAMAAPSAEHQRILVELTIQFGTFLRGKTCRLFVAPFDVRLNFDKRDDIVVQPDLLVVCDQKKLEDGKALKGAPDMAIEITSPSTSRNDRLLKLNRYSEYGVREYWIVEPDVKLVTVFILENGKSNTRVFAETETIPVHILEGCNIDLSFIFEPIPEPGPAKGPAL